VSCWQVREAARAEREDRPSPEAQGFEAFFEAEYERLFGTMCLVVDDRSDAEDVAQEAFLRVWVRWERVATTTSPRGYLYQTAFNVFRNRLRATRRAPRGFLASGVDPDPTRVVDDRTTVLGALRALPPRSRAAVVLTELLGFSSEEAGRMLGVKASTARSLATHARTELRRQLGETYE
jgi:RNA polymerase sigma factor (sigma-70 family)